MPLFDKLRVTTLGVILISSKDKTPTYKKEVKLSVQRKLEEGSFSFIKMLLSFLYFDTG
ncbi:MAG: hypothetical protein MAGBODY4_00877 [Candidatus Marinimicrobia bacterium]|nr:hypothetical protein [Candidatus Neomarinimicrobiota bacterium]